MSRARYIEDADYDRTVDALAQAGRMTRDEVMLILGEAGNIWPHSILRDVIITVAAENGRRA
jgi:hypothetical protein